MLHPDFREYIEILQKMKTPGCVLTPRSSVPRLLEVLKEAQDQEGKAFIPFRELAPSVGLPALQGAHLLIVREEDYSANPDWAFKLRDLATYFFRVE